MRQRADRARRHPLVRAPRGLPHRGARPDEGAARQEHADRAGRRQGRVRRAPAAPRRSAARSARAKCCSATSSYIRCLLQLGPTTSSTARSSRRARCAAATSHDPYLVVAADKGTASYSDVANAISDRIRLLAGRRLCLGRLGRLRPQEDGHHGARRLGMRQAALPRARRRYHARDPSRWPASATCPATCSATACCSRRTSACRRPSTTATSSSIPIRMRAAASANATRLFRLPRSSWADYDRALSVGGRRHPRSRPEVAGADAAGARAARPGA